MACGKQLGEFPPMPVFSLSQALVYKLWWKKVSGEELAGFELVLLWFGVFSDLKSTFNSRNWTSKRRKRSQIPSLLWRLPLAGHLSSQPQGSAPSPANKTGLHIGGSKLFFSRNQKMKTCLQKGRWFLPANPHIHFQQPEERPSPPECYSSHLLSPLLGGNETLTV